MKIGIRFRLLISLLIVLGMALWLTSVVLIRDADERIQAYQYQQAVYQARTFAVGSIDALISKDYEFLEHWVKSVLPSDAYAYAALVKPDGHVISSSDLELVGNKVKTSAHIVDEQTIESEYQGRPVRLIITSSSIGDMLFANAHIAYYTDIQYQQREDTVRQLVGIMLLCGVLLIVGVSIVTEKVMSPVRVLTKAVMNFSPEKGIRFPVEILRRKDEIGMLARTFDDLAYRLHQSYIEIKRKSDELEEQVKRRTAKLETSNQALSSAQEELEKHRDHLQELVDERTTELQEALEEAQSAWENAEQANQAKTEFLNNMSHELRTPLHGMMGFAQLGKDHAKGSEESKYQQYFEIILDSGERLAQLLTNLLDVSRMQAGYTELDLESFNLNELVHTVVEKSQSLCDDKSLKLVVDQQTADDVAMADPKLIGQAIENIVKNAIDYSLPETDVQIRLEDDVIDEGSSQNIEAIKISVIDQGVEIPDEELESIFNVFTQSSITKTGAGGQGLGLSMAQQIVEAHKGRIWAENLGEGRVAFHFSIPKACPEEHLQKVS